MRDSLQLTGRIEWVLHDASGNETDRGETPNLVLTYMKTQLRSVLLGMQASFMPPCYIGLGSTEGDITLTDTSLATPVLYDGTNQAKMVNSMGPFGESVTVRYVIQFDGDEAAGVIRQIGLFDDANDGNLWAKLAVTINKAMGERLTIYWYITFV